MILRGRPRGKVGRCRETSLKAGTKPALFYVQLQSIRWIFLDLASYIVLQFLNWKYLSIFLFLTGTSMLNVIFFRTETGREPVREWLDNFGEEDGNIIDLDIRVVAEYWPQVLQTNLVKKMTGEEHLWEIRSRISEGKRTARILFTLERQRMILLHGFIKKSRKTPRKDLRLARRRRDLSKSRRA